jgi:hypothetical protein
MKYLPFLLAAVVAALLAPLHPSVVSAQLEQTPILGEPVVVTPLSTSVTTQEPTPDADSIPTVAPSTSPTSSAAVATASPDPCEPNDTSAQACVLPLDAVSGPFTIVPETDQDFYRLELPEEVSILTVITVRATQGLDLALSARQGNTLVASGTYSLTLAPNITGSIVLRVENRDPRPAAGEQYRIEVRREIVPPRQQDESEANSAPDSLENNWSFDSASGIAVGVVYDLSFACPEQRPDACPGGDHDYLLVPVKAGVPYLVTTLDLDPGVDTVIELFWGTTTAPNAGNDDYASGGTLSALHWTAPNDGLLVVRIAPRNGGLVQHLVEAKTGYRFAIAPQASELGAKLEAMIRTQANVPTPTAASAAASSSSLSSGGGAAGGSTVPPSAGNAGLQESITAGSAVIVRETVLRREPSERATALATLAPESRVTVRGPVNGLWVSVETDASILPGWIRFSDLQRVAEATSPTASSIASPSTQQPAAAEQPTPASMPSVSAAGSSNAASPQVVTTELDPALPPPPSPPAARVPFALSVAVAATDRPSTGNSVLGFATPTPDMRLPVARVRIQLLNVFGDVLAEGLTDAQGTTQLRRDVRPGDALLVRIPAWGIEIALAANQNSLIVTIPEGLR